MRIPSIQRYDGTNALFSVPITDLGYHSSPIQMACGEVYSFETEDSVRLDKDSNKWDDKALQYSIVIMDLKSTGSIVAGTNVNLVDNLTPGINMCVARCIDNGVVDILRIPDEL